MPDEQYLSPTLIQCFLYELFEAGRANAYFRFVLREEETDAIRLLLWVFNWDTKVAVGGDSLSGAVRLQDSVRLLYTVIGGDANQLVNQWTESNEQVETLQLPQNLCSRLIGTLQSATEQLPSSEQTAVGGHRLAFLPVSRI
jgi:hypothetical protein